jgi:prepilin signal peptidase PulO-like enzyme (type II secretory pathway)
MVTTAVLVAIGALFAGGVINYFADQLPRKSQLTRPLCERCHTPLPPHRWFALTRSLIGGCSCAADRAPRRVIVELAAILVLSGLKVSLPTGVQFWLLALLLVCFGLIIIVDYEHQLILNAVAAPTAVAALAYGLLGAQHGWVSTLGGALAGYGLMFAVFLGGRLFVRVTTRRHDTAITAVALGRGDVSLGAIIGLAAGLPGVMPALFYGVCAGGLGALIIRLRRDYRLFTAMPYGLLLVSGAAAFLWLQAAI